MKIEIEKKEKVLFVYEFALKLISFIFEDPLLEGAFITDGTYLSDFRSFNPKYAHKVEGDIYYFKFTCYRANQSNEKYGKNFFELNEEEKETLKYEKVSKVLKKDLLFDQEIVDKVNKQYNSNINEDDLELPLYELAFKVKSVQ